MSHGVEHRTQAMLWPPFDSRHQSLDERSWQSALETILGQPCPSHQRERCRTGLLMISADKPATERNDDRVAQVGRIAEKLHQSWKAILAFNWPTPFGAIVPMGDKLNDVFNRSRLC
jgi:hypothetical protein